MEEKFKINLDSEVGELEGVLLHKPGREIENMTPANAKRALYSDILNLAVASKEYSQLSGVLEKVSKVFYVEKLLTEVLENQATKNSLIHKITENCIHPEIRSTLIEQEPHEVARLLIEGVPLPKNSLTNFLSKDYFALQPLHNFFYMRDSSSAVLDAVLINRMANNVRRREALIMEAIFENHPRFITRTFNPELSRYFNNELTMEGGDILVARKDVLIIGMGSRTSAQGIDYIANKIESREYPRNIIVQELPDSPESFIHLDMVFTLLDHDKCMIYEPVMLKSNKYSTIHLTVDNGKIKNIKYKENVLDALKSLKIDLKPVLCGGKHEHNQEREQWHSGANFFAFAPGKVIGYERNVHTIDEMNRSGFEVVSATDVIEGKVDLNKIEKVVVTIHGSELSRGGGGARCMTMPIKRKES
ncbi:MAG: arginine deiminase [Bacteroidales bacterium]|nr:arginine deiminase [Bacteroidales bacterium]